MASRGIDSALHHGALLSSGMKWLQQFDEECGKPKKRVVDWSVDTALLHDVIKRKP